jgi:hypothetical protein
MPNDDGIIRIGTEVDLSALREAQAAVDAASRNMAAAQLEFGKAAEQGNAQAAEAMKIYQAELKSAEASLAAYSAQTEVATASTRGLDTAAAALAGRIGGGFLGAQLGRVASQFGLLGSAASALTPIFLGIAGVDFGVHLAEQAYEAYESFLSLDAINQKLYDDVRKLQQADFVNVHSIEVATARLKEADAATTNLREFAEGAQRSGLMDIFSGNVAAGASIFAAGHSAAEATLATSKQSNELDARKLEIQHQQNMLQIEAAHAADAALIGEQRVTAELQKRLALNKEEAEYSRQRDRLAGNTVPENAGEGERTLKDAQARGEAQAQLANLARENYTKELAFQQETGRLIDEEARKEVEGFNKAAQAAREHLNQVAEYTRSVERLMEEDDRQSLDYHKNYEAGLEKVAEAQSKAKEMQAQTTASIEEAAIAFQVATGGMTQLGAAHARAAIHAADYTAKLRELEAELERINSNPNLTQTQKDEKSAPIQSQIGQVKGQQQATAIQDQTQIAQQAAQPWLTAANQVSDAWIGAFNKILVGGRQSWYAARQAGEQMTMALIGDAEKYLEKKLQNYILEKVFHLQTEAAKVAATTSANATAQASTSAANVAQALSYAAVAAAGAAAATAAIPIVGPALAPAAAAATYADTSAYAALAAFDTGGIIPRDGIIMAHEKEAVLPERLTSFLMDAAGQSSQDGQPAGMQLHYNPVFQSGGTPSDARKTARDLSRMLRRMNLTT